MKKYLILLFFISCASDTPAKIAEIELMLNSDFNHDEYIARRKLIGGGIEYIYCIFYMDTNSMEIKEINLYGDDLQYLLRHSNKRHREVARKLNYKIQRRMSNDLEKYPEIK